MSVHPHPLSLWDHFEIAMARYTPEFLFTHEENDGIYVQLGPGHKLIHSRYSDGSQWVNLDYPEWDANKDPLPFKDESVHGICTYHAMDHFEHPVKVLAEVQRVLVMDGWFVNIAGHYTSELAHNCFEHKTRFAVDVWRNVFSEQYYDLAAVGIAPPTGWRLRIAFNMIMGLTERNVVLVTQLRKTEEPQHH